VDKTALPKADLSANASQAFVAPSSDAEQVLADIWKELLHIDQVGVNDNFFELGGHSLMAMRLIAAIRKKMQIEVRLRDVFQFSTVVSLSKYIEIQKTMYSQEEDLSEFEIVNI
jgi:acyl carrier protein